jgi:hypothetical protein
MNRKRRQEKALDFLAKSFAYSIMGATDLLGEGGSTNGKGILKEKENALKQRQRRVALGQLFCGVS